MPLVSAKCTNCGTVLEVDDTKGACVCEHCHEAFVVEEAINDYCIESGNSAQSTAGNKVSGKLSDFVILAGELQEYTGASTDVVIPNIVKSIDSWVFSDYSITSVTIPDSVIEIGESAFNGCSSLTSVTIPDSVIEIGESAFKGCSSLTSITIPNNVTKIGESTFAGCSSLTSITIPNNVTEIARSTFEGCSSLTSVTIPNSVTKIGWRAFKGCNSLTNITIPDSVREIDGSFEGCSGLTSITIPDGVRKIDSAFKNCSSLANVIFNSKAVHIDLFDFWGTPFGKTIDKRKREHRCCYCGGSFTGLFNKVCTSCGRSKKD